MDDLEKLVDNADMLYSQGRYDDVVAELESAESKGIIGQGFGSDLKRMYAPPTKFVLEELNKEDKREKGGYMFDYSKLNLSEEEKATAEKEKDDFLKKNDYKVYPAWIEKSHIRYSIVAFVSVDLSGRIEKENIYTLKAKLLPTFKPTRKDFIEPLYKQFSVTEKQMIDIAENKAIFYCIATNQLQTIDS